jgi:hypothetical protein
MAALQIAFLLIAVWAAAVEKNGTVRIKVLDSESRSSAMGDQVPRNCDGVNFDAYCLNSKTSMVTNTLLVQEGDHPPYRISCNIDTKWSHCVPLEKGVTVDARRDKRGLIVYYIDDKGKVRKQLYTYVEPERTQTASAVAAPIPEKAAPAAQSTANPAAAETVKCSFSSTPPGADITLDGKYVGSTPSVISVSSGGQHAVEMSLPGFAAWKRNLTVGAGSELTVNAVLEKAQ